MGNWFNKHENVQAATVPTATSNSPYSLVCKSAHFKGDITSDLDVRVEGVLEGDVDIKGTLYIAPGGRVITQSVVCGTADVAGEISGSLTANESLCIRAGGVVTGDISVANMVIEQGGFFDGTSHKIKLQAKAAPIPEGLAKEIKATPSTGGSKPELRTETPH